ncbi:hypothetical protein B0T26DRAFT_740133 [Lasiosphaeria miniovina]|uniref:Zn(2)-C6 fungal-type domain-containing protein n=1 Tax=Lasiosphaeria miniovina TaxID=1954250 RepID=A0AA40AW88_9PEZI|nr:uncharacterized protein B0T26DRAFT_740133 [Lasiosphaeria miniovina]KAK0723089.1 hypothetical protein B0T26DRAFT_740133 [Lasiosphaeria miniovina]
MVYCGKPSKGCSNCRERKIRCDQREPGCGQCEKRQQGCPGYRNLVDLMFRDESSHVIKKAKARARKKNLTVEPGTPSDTDGRLSLTPEPRSKSLTLVMPVSPMPGTPTTEQSGWNSDDSSLLMSPDSGSWPVTPAMALFYNLAPTCQENGTAYFFSRYVTMDETACHQKFDFVYDVWKPSSVMPEREVDGVLASMTAVGLMGLASMTRSRDFMDAARKSYGTALQLTNHALKNPVEAVKDSTMLSVLILGVFEMMTENTPRIKTVKAFQEHVNGAAALAKMRGVAQFRTRAGKRMFSMLCQRVVISCIQRHVPMPQPLVELWQEASETLDPRDPTRWITPLMFQILQLRYDIKRGAITDPEAIVGALLSIEEDCEKLTTQLPPSWQYRTFKLTRQHPAVYEGVCHLYSSLWHATVWNGLRTARILVLETILSEIYRESQSFSPRLASSRYTEEFNRARRKLKQMIQAVNASVPQHLGLVNPVDGSIESMSPASTPISSVEVRETPSPATSPSSRSSDSGSSNYGGYSPSQPSGLTILDTTGARDAEDEAGRFMLLVSATSTIVWPLYVVGMSSACDEDTKAYVIERLRTLYMETGIRQADALANLLEEHESAESVPAPVVLSTLTATPPMITTEFDLPKRYKADYDTFLV